MPNSSNQKQSTPKKTKTSNARFLLIARNSIWGLAVLLALYLGVYSLVKNTTYEGHTVKGAKEGGSLVSSIAGAPSIPLVDKVAYDKKMIQLANYPALAATVSVATSASSPNTIVTSPLPPAALWPATAAYPGAGALLPAHRIVAYYGNFYSKGMGILGQYPPDQVIDKLNNAVTQWQAADPSTPIIPAIDYIAISAQGYAGSDGKYRARMPANQIDKAVSMANQVHGIVILDVQMGQSTVQTEIPLLEKYLQMPNVELALDPEFSMKEGQKPGTVIGSMDAKDINYVISYLSGLVKQYNIPPKILVVHRFTEDMVTNHDQIVPTPEVQVVMDMDGWGLPSHKITTYHDEIYDEPVQFTGFKLFYGNDLKKKGSVLMTPTQVLELKPQPSFIQYQ